MIPHELLREAAARTCESYVYGLLSDYNPECRYVFSADFEKKIDRLKRRADHPVLYRTMRRVAIIILALLFAGTVWVAVDAEARAAFFGWISEMTDSYFIYRHIGAASEPGEPVDYRPTWIPEGYWEDSVRVFNDKTTVRYKNDSGELLRFSYVNTNRDYNWAFDVSKGHTEDCLVGDHAATLFVTGTEGVASDVIWVDSNAMAFMVTGFVSEADLIRMAESVRQISG